MRCFCRPTYPMGHVSEEHFGPPLLLLCLLKDYGATYSSGVGLLIAGPNIEGHSYICPHRSQVIQLSWPLWSDPPDI